MSKKSLFTDMAEEEVAADKPAQAVNAIVNDFDGDHVNKVAKQGFAQLKDRSDESKAEIVMVGIRMTKSERRQLKAMSWQLDTPIQDIVREGISLVRKYKGLRG